MTKSHEYEVVRHDKDMVMGRVWWDGKQIQATKPSLLTMLRMKSSGAVSFDDGEEFLEKLPMMFRSGYTSVRKVS